MMSRYEYSMRVTKSKITTKEFESAGEHAHELIDFPSSSVRFHSKHPQYATHRQIVIDVSNPRTPHAIPIMLGYILPCKTKDPEKYHLILLTTFTPYCFFSAKDITLHPGSKTTMTYTESWTYYMTVLKENDPIKYDWIQAKVKNTVVLREGKEIHRKECAERRRLDEEQGIVKTRNPARTADGVYDYDEIDDGGNPLFESSLLVCHDTGLLQSLKNAGGPLGFSSWTQRKHTEFSKLCLPFSALPNRNWMDNDNNDARDGYITGVDNSVSLATEHSKHFIELKKAKKESMQMKKPHAEEQSLYTRRQEPPKRPEEISKELGLDEDQTDAFLTIACSVLLRENYNNNVGSVELPEQLVLYMGGEGGTGKSKVLKALVLFLESLHLIHQLRRAAPTGVAAGNIDGCTIHSLFRIIPRKSKAKTTDETENEMTKKPAAKKSKTQTELKSSFADVTIIFVDEVSMLNCSDLNTINTNLKNLKGNNTLFGGVNMVFAGDFYQLAPVSGTPLYKQPTPGRDQNLSNDSAGYLAFINVNKAIVLRTQHRIQDEDYKRVVQNFRNGCSTHQDTLYVTAKIIKSCIEGTKFADSVVIVKSNALKSYINQKKAISTAKAKGKKLLYCVAKDNHTSPEATKDIQICALQAESSGTMNYSSGILPMFVGMPVMTKYNEATELGVSNGSTGRIKSIVLDPREIVDYSDIDKPHYLLYHPLVVYVVLDVEPNKDGNIPTRFQIEGLEPNVFPMLPPTVKSQCHKCTYIGDDKLTYTITRSQFYFLPAFAITVNQSQGRTLHSAVVVLEGKYTVAEKPYVMLSRLTNGSNMGVLGGWDKNFFSTLRPNATMLEYLVKHIYPKVVNTRSEISNVKQKISKLYETMFPY